MLEIRWYRRDKKKLLLPTHGQPKHVGHVYVLLTDPTGELPIEAVDKVGEHRLHGGHPETQPGADPPPGSERQELEIPPLVVDLAATVQHEPLRLELLCVLPPRLCISSQNPRVDDDMCPRRDSVSIDVVAAGDGDAREEERHRRVQPECLLHDSLQVRHAAQVLLFHRMLILGRLAPHLSLELGHDVWLPHELRHDELHDNV